MFSGQVWLVLPPLRKWPGSFKEPGLMRQGSRENQCSSAQVGEVTASGSNWLSKGNVVLVNVYRNLVYALLFSFRKKQIMCFTRKSWRGSHVPLGPMPPKTSKRRLIFYYSSFRLSGMNPSSLGMVMQGCYSWKPREIIIVTTVCPGWKFWMSSMPLRSHFK